MIIHKIHGLDNEYVIDILSTGLSNVSDSDVDNYSPLAAACNSNLFYILKEGRYREGNGAYYVAEENGKFIASAGWNMYTEDTAIVLSRAYVAKEHRTSYVMGHDLMPLLLADCAAVPNVWITCNEKNITIYRWFLRAANGKRGTFFKNWPDIYSKFVPIGKKIIYFTEQYVVELVK